MLRSMLLAGLVVASCLACGAESNAADDGDPGKPDLMYGTKAGGDLLVDGRKVGYILFGFIAPDEPDRAHVFARPDLGSSEGVKSFYMSLVLSNERWAAGKYTGAIAGRVECVLENGTRYAATATELALNADILWTRATEGGQYPAGYLDLMVPAVQRGDEPLEAHITINNPDAVAP